MFMMMRYGVAVALLSLCVVTAPAGVQAYEDITGSYRCQGQNPGGNSYEGQVKITKKGATYLLQWTISGASHVGVGILNGDLLSSSWRTPSGGGGVVVYRIEQGAQGLRLVGQWSDYPGDGSIQPETLTRTR